MSVVTIKANHCLSVSDNIIVCDTVMLAAAAAPTDLKMIDSEMQAILAELLMPGPQPVPQPQLTRLPFSSENAVSRHLMDNSQPQILSQQVLQIPGALLIVSVLCSKQQSVFWS